MTRARGNRKSDATEQRREKLAEALVSGAKTRSEIAAEVGTNLAAVKRDLSALAEQVMSKPNNKVARARAIVESDPKLKKLFNAFTECMNYSEEEALAATLGKRFSEPTDILGSLGGTY